MQSIQIHEEFENFNHQYFRNDIALLKLTRSIDFSPYVLPICLPSKAMAKAPVDALSGEIATVIGYGRISYSKLKYVFRLVQVEVKMRILYLFDSSLFLCKRI